jgi:hypothetical protein
MSDGLCECGCGGVAPVNPRNDRYNGLVRGQPRRYIAGHHKRRAPTPYLVDEATGCWEWQWAKNRGGYGHTRATDGRSIPAHRKMWEAVNGPVPEGLELDHLCRNRSCVNPAHLEPVTRGENARRGARAKLTWDLVAEVRSSPESIRQIAARLGFHRSTIQAVRARRSWWPEPDA